MSPVSFLSHLTASFSSAYTSVLTSCILKAHLPPALPPPQAAVLPFFFPWLPKPFKACLCRPPAASHHPLLSSPAQSGSPSQSIAVLVPSKGACDLLLPNPAGLLVTPPPTGPLEHLALLLTSPCLKPPPHYPDPALSPCPRSLGLFPSVLAFLERCPPSFWRSLFSVG